MLRLMAFVPVSEPWYGNYKIANDARHDKTLLVSVHFGQLSDRTWRVSVWGNDDHGLEKDYPPGQRDKALALYQKIVSTPMLTHRMLEQAGMVRA